VALMQELLHAPRGGRLDQRGDRCPAGAATAVIPRQMLGEFAKPGRRRLIVIFGEDRKAAQI
jgi:hypothetical protein